MAIQRWRPDTCECIVDEQVHGPNEKSFLRAVHKCSAHASVSDAELYDVLYASPDSENRRKNEIHTWLLEQPDVADATVEPSGQISRQLKPNQAFGWRFEGEGRARTLVISGITPDTPKAPGQKATSLSQRQHPHAGKVRFE